MKLPAIFFDRDDTLIEEVKQVTPNGIVYCRSVLRPEETVLCIGAKEILKKAKLAGYYRIVCSNQGAIEAKLTNIVEVDLVHGRMYELLEDELAINGFYVCPHKSRGEDRPCPCGKPNPGMFIQAAKDFDIDMKNSHAVGDNPRDLLAAQRAGVGGKMIFIDKEKHSPEAIAARINFPIYYASNLLDASDILFNGGR